MGVAEVVLGRIADGELVIIDGGMGSQLQAEGVPMDEVAWSARANLEQPDVVQHVHEEYIRAGAEVIIANTFAASRAGPGARRAGRPRRRGQPQRHARGAAGPRGRRHPPGGGGRLDVIVLPRSPWIREHWATVKPGPADEDPRFPSLADFREQAGLLAEAGADLIALEMIDARGYGRAALQAAAETGLPVWLGISPARLDDGTLGTLPELGDGDSLDDLLSALADPSLAAVTVMHADPEADPGRDRDHPRSLRRADRGLRRDGQLAAAELGLRRPDARPSTSSRRSPGPTTGRGSSADAAVPDPGTYGRSPTGYPGDQAESENRPNTG